MKLPQPSPWSPGGGATQKCSENVGKMFGTGGAPSPASPLGCVSSKMFGKCSELVGAPVPWVVAPSPPPPRKSSEMLGNVRKMFGKCSELVWPAQGGRLVERPPQFRTFSEHFQNISEDLREQATAQMARHPPTPNIFHKFPDGTLSRGKVGGAARPVPNISEHFRTFPNLFGGGGGAGGRPPKGERHPTILNMFQTFSEHFCRNRHPGEWRGRGDGKAPAPYSTPPRRHLQYVSPTRTPTGGSDRPPKQKSAPLWPGGLSTGISNAVSSSTQSLIRNRHHDSRTRGSGAPGKHLQV